MQAHKAYNCYHVVTLEETNLVGNVNVTHYLRWQGHCREQFLIECAPSILPALTADFALATVSCHCDFFAELYAADIIEIRVGLRAIEDHRITMTFDYYRLKGTPQCQGDEAVQRVLGSL